MRSRPQAGITFFQLLLAVALVWAAITLLQSRPPWLTRLVPSGDSAAGAYFASVLRGIERVREVDARTPLPQGCEAFTARRLHTSGVHSCSYQPSSSRTFYIVTVTSKTGEVFRYSGRGDAGR